MRPVLSRTIAAVVAAFVVVGAALPASAEDRPVPTVGIATPRAAASAPTITPTTTAPTTVPSTTVPSLAGAMGPAASVPGAPVAGTGVLSLTALLAKYQADGEGVDLSAYLRDRGGELDATLGTGSVFGSDAFQAMAVNSPTFESLNAQLVSHNFGQPGATGAGGLAVNLAEASATPDAAAVAGGIDLARTAGQLAPLATPELNMPQLGRAGTILSAGPEELAFGLFANQSLARAVQGAPDLIGQVRGGQLSPASMSAFRNSMSATAADLAGGLGSSLPSPCYAGMMMGVASGSAAGARALGLPRECDPCITAGTYLSGRMGSLLTPGQFSSNPNDGNITPFEWQNLDPATRQALERLNPSLADQAGPAPSAGNQAAMAQSCTQSAAGTRNYLNTNLGGLLGRLGG